MADRPHTIIIKMNRRSTVYNELNITVSSFLGDQEAGSNASVLGKLWATDEQDVLALGEY